MSAIHKVKIAGKEYEYDDVSIRGNGVTIPVRNTTGAWKVLAKLQKLGYSVVLYGSIGMIPIFKKVNKLAVCDDVASDMTPVIVGTEVKTVLTHQFNL